MDRRSPSNPLRPRYQDDDDEDPYCQFEIGEHNLGEYRADAEELVQQEEEEEEEDDGNDASRRSQSCRHRRSRPKALVMTLKQDMDIGGSLPSHPKLPVMPRHTTGCENSRGVPKIRCNYISAPATPCGEATTFAWTRDNDTRSIASIDEEALEAELLSPDDAISICSVENLGGRSNSHRRRNSVAKCRRSLSRLSLNLVTERSSSPSPTLDSGTIGKSPGIIPRFLRNSFSRLLMRGNSNKPNEAPSPAFAVESLAVATLTRCASATFENSNNITSSSSSPPQSDVVYGSVIPSSPSFIKYFEESRLSGLPVIPFAYPTHVVAEKMRETRKKQQQLLKQKTPSSESAKSSSEPKAIAQKRQLIRKLSVLDYDIGELEPKSLENLVHIAERELARESLYGNNPDNFHNLSAAYDASVALLASSSGDSSVKTWPSCEFEIEDEEEEEEGFDLYLGRKRNNGSDEDDGYIEMVPKSCHATPSPPFSAASLCKTPSPASVNLRGQQQQQQVKCLLLRAEETASAGGDEEEEHFKMDFSSNKG